MLKNRNFFRSLISAVIARFPCNDHRGEGNAHELSQVHETEIGGGRPPLPISASLDLETIGVDRYLLKVIYSGGPRLVRAWATTATVFSTAWYQRNTRNKNS